MPDLKPVSFKPRWMQQLSADDQAALAETPALGDFPDEPPRVCPRILPRDESCRLTAKTVSEVIELIQNLVCYAGHDVYHGPNPDFADLRSLSADVIEFTRLTIEPFEAGSFIIPTRLEAKELVAPRGAISSAPITTDRVAQRFSEILEQVGNPDLGTRISFGALQTIKGLGRVLKREAGSIEFSAFDSRSRALPRQVVHEEYITRVCEVLQSRRPSHNKVEAIEGKVTALDIVDGTLSLSLGNTRRRTKGVFSPMFHPTLLESLGKRVRLQGMISQKSSSQTIQIVDVEILDSDSQ